MAENHTERCSVCFSWFSQHCNLETESASQDEAEASGYMTQESRYGLNVRHHHIELTSGYLGCHCQLAGYAFKCHLYCFLK